MTLIELQTAKDALQKAIYSGTLEVRKGDRLLRYQNITEMRQALSDLNDEIAAALNGNMPRSMCTFVQFNG